jgi:uncharacterized protein YnzC (UPF0291/DUF896 family)
MFQAFNGMASSTGKTLWLKEKQKGRTLTASIEHRLKTLHAQYLKSLRKDRSLIHL